MSHQSLSTDDIAHMPHIVIVESAEGIRVIEFDRGQMMLAHEKAREIALDARFNGRVIVAMRVRQIGRPSIIRS